MNSAESRIFPTGPVGRGGRPGGPGAAPPAARRAATASDVRASGRRLRSRRVRAQHAAPFIVVQDERWYIPEDAPPGQDGKPRTDLPFMPVMLDNLIYEKRLPPIVAVLLAPGPADSARSSTTPSRIAT